MTIKRWDIINAFIKKYDYKTFLEIGLDEGHCRDNVDIELKESVDPSDVCDNPTYKTTSDHFFELQSLRQNPCTYDIIFVDGLHEANQVYRDIINSLKFLNEGGTILCHDIMPPHELSQVVPRMSGQWCGDCWKAWVKLLSERSDLDMYVVTEDYGVGVIRKGNRSVSKEMNKPIDKMDWDFYRSVKNKMNYISYEEFCGKMDWML